MKVASFNANGIRARMPILIDWLGKESPDVLCLQETKVQDHDFPEKPLIEAGYHCAYKGQKSYNGVAILSKNSPDEVRTGFDENDETEGPRLIRAVLEGVTIVNTYIPQGQAPESDKFAYKLDWFSRLRSYFETNFDPEAPIVWVGDFNVAPQSIDVHDPESLKGSVGFHPEEHKALSEVKEWGFIDIFRKHSPEDIAFTFWDYRVPNAAKRGIGWRLDHIWGTRCMADKSTGAWIDKEPRLMVKPSDHTFIVAEFE